MIDGFKSLNFYCLCYHCMQDQDQKLSELETENRKMKLELEEYRAEAAHLKNQQATIRRLEERNRQLEQQVCSVKLLCDPLSYHCLRFCLLTCMV
jgi:Tfp pilus assembly protein PilO